MIIEYNISRVEMFLNYTIIQSTQRKKRSMLLRNASYHFNILRHKQGQIFKNYITYSLNALTHFFELIFPT